MPWYCVDFSYSRVISAKRKFKTSLYIKYLLKLAYKMLN